MNLFKVPTLNAHYEGSYEPRELQWRRLGATDKAANIALLLGGRSVSRVLEVGCGTGAVLAALSRMGHGHELVGVDLADPGQHVDPGAEGILLRSYDGEALPFQDSAFDLVFASHVLEHVPNPRGLLAEMHRVSSRFVCVEVPCELHLRTSIPNLQKTLDIGHINSYTPESFRLLLETSGLSVEALELFDVSRATLSFASGRFLGTSKSLLRRFLLKISPTLASRLLTYHCCALVRK